MTLAFNASTFAFALMILICSASFMRSFSCDVLPASNYNPLLRREDAAGSVAASAESSATWVRPAL
jgi:hypothetical protein